METAFFFNYFSVVFSSLMEFFFYTIREIFPISDTLIATAKSL